MDLLQLYKHLRKKHGKQGWWPLMEGELTYSGESPSNEQRFEVAVGCVLAQNTQFHPNVEESLKNLHKANMLNPLAIKEIDIDELAKLVEPSGYKNKKAKYLKNLTDFFLSEKEVTRENLLEVKGIGKETADSILLYAFDELEFVIDKYTKDFLKRNDYYFKDDYDKIKALVEESIPKNITVYKEFHALIVQEGKVYKSEN